MKDLEKDLMSLRLLTSRLGWGKFMYHLGCLMAEQGDKLETDQGAALRACSRTIHALQEPFNSCGRFEYPQSLVGSEGLPDDESYKS